jgi:hypothetical protein
MIQLTDRTCSSNCLTTVPYLVAQTFEGLLLGSYHGVWIDSRCPLPSWTFFALTDAKDEFGDRHLNLELHDAPELLGRCDSHGIKV